MVSGRGGGGFMAIDLGGRGSGFVGSMELAGITVGGDWVGGGGSCLE